MKIVISEKGRQNIRLPVPSGLVLNRFTAWLCPNYLKRYGVDITRKQAAAFITALNRYRREHPEWVLIEAESADGGYVKIKL